MNVQRKPRNGPETKKAVLVAATKVFSDKGFNGTSLAAISEVSGVSVGLIVHHFGTKDELHRAVLRELAEFYRMAILTSAQNAVGKGGDVAAAALESVFHFWAQDEVYARISQWSFLEGKNGLAEAEAATSVGLAEEVRKMQAAGRADTRFDPHVLLAMTIGPIHFWNRYRESFRVQLGLVGSSAELDEAFLRQYKALVKKLYEPGPGPGAAAVKPEGQGAD